MSHWTLNIQECRAWIVRENVAAVKMTKMNILGDTAGIILLELVLRSDDKLCQLCHLGNRIIIKSASTIFTKLKII